MTTKLEELLVVLCLVLVLILMLAVAVALAVLVLMLCGNQIGRAYSIPVSGVDVDIDVSDGAGIWRW